MNDLTGAFIYAIENGIDINLIRQGFINAGFPAQEVQEALMEAQQINAMYSLQKKETKKRSSNGKIFFIIILLFFISVILGFFVWYFFLGGKESEFLSSLLQKLKLKE
ncbi:MAG: hypothetical protein QXX68_02545 [Candidatus Pacearchaeota archaeon]